MTDIIQHVQDSVAQREVDIKEYKAQVDAYDAETKRISAIQQSLNPEQIQDIVMGTIAAALDTGDLIGGMPEMRERPEMGEQEPPEQPQMGGTPMEAPEQPKQPMMAPEAPEQPPEGMMQ
jgi:hypothetical protein